MSQYDDADHADYEWREDGINVSLTWWTSPGGGRPRRRSHPARRLPRIQERCDGGPFHRPVRPDEGGSFVTAFARANRDSVSIATATTIF
jgi:hypothetical protein